MMFNDFLSGMPEHLMESCCGEKVKQDLSEIVDDSIGKLKIELNFNFN